MADNITANPGTGGDTIAADDIAGIKHQRVKISQGADGAATDVSSAAPLNVTLANTGANATKILTTPDLPSGASTSALQTQPGVDIGDVTINNAAGGSAVNIQDGGNTITVDGTVAVTGVSTLAEQQTQTTALQLLDDTIKVLGTDTYAEATTKGSVVGAVRRDANTSLVDTTNEVAPLQVNATGELKVAQIQALPTGSNVIGALTANQAVNVAQINGVAPSMGSGINGTGVQRVNLATDQAALTTAGLMSVKVDQTTVGTTNAVSLAQLGANTVATGNGASSTGVQRVAQVNDGTGVLATVSTVTSLTQMNGAAIAMNTGVRAAGVQRVTIATDDVVPASQSGTWTVQPGNTANSTPWLVTDSPATTGGLSKFHLVGAATDNATNVKASAGQVYTITAFNVSASPRYLKFHNTAGAPTAGTGVTDTYLIPGNTSGAGVVINLDKGIAFSTGIAITLVTGIADANTTAIGASEVVINIYYK